MGMMASVMVVDHNRLFREGLKCILAGQGFKVETEAHTFLGAFRLLQRRKSVADLLLGGPGPDLKGEVEAVKALLRQFPELKIVILADQLVPPWSELTLASSAVGFLSQDISAKVLKHSLDLVAAGGQISPTVAPRAPKAVPAAPRPDSGNPAMEILATLSGRENQILECLVNGLPNKLIARQLNMAEATVKVHLKALLRKLKARNRTQAAIWAIRSRTTAARTALPDAVDAIPTTNREVRPKRSVLLERPQGAYSGRGTSLALKVPAAAPANDKTDTAMTGGILLN